MPIFKRCTIKDIRTEKERESESEWHREGEGAESTGLENHT